ncbi:hypothetical protein CSUI_004605, partial [Cystoisospora suis]
FPLSFLSLILRGVCRGLSLSLVSPSVSFLRRQYAEVERSSVSEEETASPTFSSRDSSEELLSAADTEYT